MSVTAAASRPVVATGPVFSVLVALSFCHLLNDMMDLTKLEGGRVRLNKGIGNVATTVGNVAQEFRVLLQSSKITLGETAFTRAFNLSLTFSILPK